VGDLEDVDRREAGRDQCRIHVLLHVAGQQEPTVPDRAQQHDRHVVDPRPAVGGLVRHRAR